MGHLAKPKIDLYHLTRVTSEHRSYMASQRRKLQRVEEDPKREKRLAQMLCAYCFYFHNSRIGGAVCTMRECAFCDKQLSSGNSCIDVCCLPCAQQHRLCTYCGGDINLKLRRKF